MITKWIQFTVRPEATDVFRAALGVLEEASRREGGCCHYTAFQTADVPNIFTVLESWESASAFEGHRVSPHVLAFKERCEAMILEKSALALNPVVREC